MVSYCGMAGKMRKRKRLTYLHSVSPIVLQTNVDARCDELGAFLIFYVLIACGMYWPVDKQLSAHTSKDKQRLPFRVAHDAVKMLLVKDRPTILNDQSVITTS